jgi:cytochrome bd-type quinol oxidase subunit 1
VSGIFGALSVIAANSWMNQPGGFTLHAGLVVAVDPVKVVFNRAAGYEMPHMLLAAYALGPALPRSSSGACLSPYAPTRRPCS